MPKPFEHAFCRESPQSRQARKLAKSVFSKIAGAEARSPRKTPDCVRGRTRPFHISGLFRRNCSAKWRVDFPARRFGARNGPWPMLPRPRSSVVDAMNDQFAHATHRFTSGSLVHHLAFMPRGLLDLVDKLVGPGPW